MCWGSLRSVFWMIGGRSEEDQAQVKEYAYSGKARRVCLKHDGMVFPENDNKLGKEKE